MLHNCTASLLEAVFVIMDPHVKVFFFFFFGTVKVGSTCKSLKSLRFKGFYLFIFSLLLLLLFSLCLLENKWFLSYNILSGNNILIFISKEAPLY